MIGVGGWDGIQVTAENDGMRALADDIAESLRLCSTFGEVFQQGTCGIFHGFHFPFAVIGRKLLLPFASVLVYAGGLQVVVQEADSVPTDEEVTHQAAVVRIRMGNESLSAERITAEYSDGQTLPARGQVAVFPMAERAYDAVRGEVPVSAHLLQANHIHLIFTHQSGYLLARIAGDFFPKVVYVVGSYFQLMAYIVFPRMKPRHLKCSG